MDQAEGGRELGGAEPLHGEQDFGGVQAELGILAGGRGPLALAAGLELGAETDHGFHARLGGEADDVVEFAQLLDHDDNLLA